MREGIEQFLQREGGALRLLLIGVLTLFLLIPLAMVEGVIEERASLHRSVLSEIARQQGDAQTILGPAILVPYVREVETPEHLRGRTGEPDRRSIGSVAVLLPELAETTAEAPHEMRRRGIYEAPVYSAATTIRARFALADLEAAIPDLASVDWSKAALTLAVADPSGLAAVRRLEIGGEARQFLPGAPAYAAAIYGEAARNSGPARGRFGAAHAPLALDGPRSLDIEIALDLNGSEGFYVAPLAGDSRIRIAGSWPHPSFQGAPLPQSREVTAEGFAADWRVPGLARGFGAIWFGPDVGVRLGQALAQGVGFAFANPEDFYVAAIRSVKYGVLFIGLTFLACFVLERLGGQRLHPAQYALVGLSLALFYLLSLALSEQIGFDMAYGAAAEVIAGMNGVYVGAALSSWRRGAAAAATLGLLYAAFHSMLESEDDALLIGSGILLLGMALAMASTAKLNRRREA